MLIYIAGSGAMGSRFGYQLTKSGQEVIFLDKWEEHIQAIKEKGLKITGDKKDLIQAEIMKPEEARNKADLIILFTKATQLKPMLEDIEKIIGKKTKLLCLLNGLGHEDVIKEYLPEKNILMGVTDWTAGLEGPGVAELMGTGSVNLQSIDPEGSEEGKEVVDVLNKAGLNAVYDEAVVPSTWRKASLNGTFNPICTLLNCTMGEFFKGEEGERIARQIVGEFVEVGKASGLDLDKEEITNYVLETGKKASHHYPSMHQDLVQNNRLTEIDYINGAVARKGKEMGIQTPYNQLITDLIHIKEEVLGAE